MSRLLGIDASRSVVRVAVLRTSYRRVALESLTEVDVASAGSEVDAIRAAVGLQKVDGISIALSGAKSFYRRLELPAAAQKEIGNVLAFELEATVPFEMSDAVWDYRTLKRADSAGTLQLFCAVARTEDVRERIDTVRAAIGVEPERVGTGPLPLANLGPIIPELDKPTIEGPLAILSLAETTSEVLVMLGGEPVFARTLSRGTMGLPDSAPALARELRQTFASWRALGGAPLAGMYLVGGGAAAHGAEVFLSTELGVSILPLPRPKLDDVTPEQAQRLPRFAQAIGLALGLGRSKSLDLRRGTLEAARSYPFLREKIPLLSGLAAVIAVSFGFSAIAELRTLEAEHELYVAKLGIATHDVLGEATTEQDKAKELLEGGGPLEEDPMPRVDAFDALVQLSKAVPRDVVHDVVEFEFARQHVNLQATVPSVADAETIAKNLRDYKCAKDVKIVRTNQSGENKQKYVLEFEVKCPEPKKKKPGSTTPEGADSAQPSASAKPSASSKPEGKDGR